MRYKRVTLSPQDKPQYEIALGVRDIELLLGEAQNAARFFPNADHEDHQRLDGIVRGLRDALEDARSLGDTGQELKSSEKADYRNHYLKKITRLEVIDHSPCNTCGGDMWFKTETNAMLLECPNCRGLGVAGRVFIFQDVNKEVTASIQDNGRTLKLFVEPRK